MSATTANRQPTVRPYRTGSVACRDPELDGDAGAGDRRGLGRRQERDECGDFLRPDESAALALRIVREEVVEVPVGVAASVVPGLAVEHGRVDIAWAHCVAAHAFRGELECERPREE